MFCIEWAQLSDSHVSSFMNSQPNDTWEWMSKMVHSLDWRLLLAVDQSSTSQLDHLHMDFLCSLSFSQMAIRS